MFPHIKKGFLKSTEDPRIKIYIISSIIWRNIGIILKIMLISLNWLKLYITQCTTEELLGIFQNQFIISSFEVESITEKKNNWEGLIVAKLLSVIPLEGSKKLKKCVVFQGRENVEVLCGGDDLIQGKNYAFAPLGSTVNGIFIEPKKIQGFSSQGMLCSYNEIAVEARGTMALIEEDFPLGTPLEELYNINFFQDYIIDISLTPNRPDCLSILGIAREIVACSGGKIKLLGSGLNPPHFTSKSENNLDIEVNLSQEDCGAFYTTVISNFTNYTPLWMKILLSNLGIKSRSLAVDVTNFLMHQNGYPIHVYHYDYLKSLQSTQSLHLTYTEGEEEFYGLDNKKHRLQQGIMVLKAGKNQVNHRDEILAVLGIMGGSQSAYVEGDRILLEVGYFNQNTIRQSMVKTKIHTQASYGFSRGVNPYNIALVIQEFLSLLQYPMLPTIISKEVQNLPNKQLTIGKIHNYIKTSLPHTSREVFLSYGELYSVTGFGIPINKQREILESLGFIALYHTITKTKQSKNSMDIVPQDEEDLNEIIGLKVTVPHWRLSDIHISRDLIEEIVRIHGVPEEFNMHWNQVRLQGKNQDDAIYNLEKNLAIFLSMLGYSETINYPFCTEEEMKRYYPEVPNNAMVQILSSQENKTYLNLSLLPKLLENWEYCLSKYQEEIFLFEIGKSYRKNREKQQNSPFSEVGSVAGLYYNKSQVQSNAFLKVKEHLRQLITAFNGDQKKLGFFPLDLLPIYDPEQSILPTSIYHPKKSAFLLYEEKIIGVVGILSSDFQLKSSLILWEILDLENLYNLNRKTEPITVYYRKKIHLSFISKSPEVHNISEVIQKLYGEFPIIREIRLLDCYRGVYNVDSIISDENISYTMEIVWDNNEQDNKSNFTQEIINKISNYLIKNYSFIIR